jgi:hypothetical protein
VNANLVNLTFRRPEYVDKQQLLRRLDKAWVAFKDSYAGLSESDVLEPGVTQAWSVRDIIAHVTTWEEEALKHLPAILRAFQRRGTAESAARSSILAATAPEAGRLNGMYIEKDGRPRRPSNVLMDAASQERAWELGMSLVADARPVSKVSPIDERQTA